MPNGPEFAININHQDARQGANALGSIENLLRSIDTRLGQIVAKSGSVNRTLQVTRNTFVQNNTAITQVNNSLTRTTNVLTQVDRGTKAWDRSLRAANRTVGRLLIGVSRLSARAGGLAASGFGTVGARGRQSFGGVFGGSGISGIAGSVIRAPFAVGEFGARIGGDLAQAIVGGAGRVLSGVGGAIGGGVGALGGLVGPAGAVAGGVLGGAASLTASGLGAIGGIGGSILGAIGQSAGAVLGAVGEFGGQIAESLTRGLSKGLLVGAGISAFSLFKAAEFQDLEQGFKTLLGNTEDYQEALGRLDKAAAGTVSRIGILKSANLALSLGVAQDSKQIETLIEGSRLLGRQLGLDPEKAFDRLTVGLARGSLKVLDDLGLNPNREKAYRDYAASIGVAVNELTDLEKQAAFSEAALKELQARVDAAKMSSDGLAQGSRRLSDLFDSVKASAVDIAIEFGNALTPAAFELGDGFSDLLRRGEEWLKLHKSDIAKGTVDFLRALPGYYNDAKKAVSELTVSFAKFIGLSDETIAAGGNALDTSKGFSGLGKRLTTFGSLFVRDVKDGLSEVFTSENIKNAAIRVGEYIGEGLLNALKSAAGSAGDLIKTNAGSIMETLDSAASSVLPPISPFGPFGPVIGKGLIYLLGDSTPTASSGGALPGGRPGPSAAQGIDPRQIPGYLPAPAEFLPPSPEEFAKRIQALGYNPTPGLVDFTAARESKAFSTLGGPLGDGDFDRLIRRAVGDFTEELRDKSKEAGEALREGLGIERGLGRDLERVKEGLEEGRAAITDILASVPEAVVAISSRFDQQSAEITSRRDAALKAVPGQVLDGVRSDVNLPGINLRARNALIKDQRLRERARADEINALFRSRGPTDPFGNVSGVTANGFAGFGSGFSGNFGDGLGELSGSDTAASYQNDLLKLVEQSVEATQLQKEIQKQAAEEQSKLEAERTAALKELSEQTRAAAAEQTRIVQENTAILRDLTAQLSIQRDRNAALDRELQDIRRQIRSVK